MKKIILCSFAFGALLATKAQLRSGTFKNVKAVSFEEVIQNKYAEQDVSNPAPFNKPVNKTAAANSAVTVVDMGQAPNAATNGFGTGTYLWADPNLNSLVFSHRSDFTQNGDGGSGWFRYDFSTDGGSSWTNNLGPIYQSAASPSIPNGLGRFPQSLIYNPSGNTTPGSAFMHYFGATSTNTNGGPSSLGGFAFGSAPLGSGSTTTQTLYSDSLTNTYRFNKAYDLTLTQNGVSWAVVPRWSAESGPIIYEDIMYLLKGTWNSGSNDFDYQVNELPMPASVSSSGGKVFTGVNIAFAPDGQTGYLLYAGHQDYNLVSDTVIYFSLYKTTDGGDTWSTNPVSTLTANQIPGVDNIFGDTILYSYAYDQDLIVDANGDPHILTGVTVAGSGFSIFPIPGLYTLYHLTTQDEGANWNSQVLAKPMTFRACFGDCPSGQFSVTEDNRMQLSTTYAGDKLFFSYFDTDTNIFGSGDGNQFPDAWVGGYDVTTNSYTCMRNVTQLTAADGLCTFGSASHYVLENGSTYTLPIAYNELQDLADVLLSTQLRYIDGITFTDADFNNCQIGIADDVKQNFSVEQNYPNPFSGRTSIELNLKQDAAVTLSVRNALGQLVYVQNQEKKSQGVHLLDVNVKLQSGVYYYTVDVDGARITKKMIAQ